MARAESLGLAMVAAIEAGEAGTLKALLAEHEGTAAALNAPVNGKPPHWWDVVGCGWPVWEGDAGARQDGTISPTIAACALFAPVC